MVGSSLDVGTVVQNLVAVREYQGSSYGSILGSRGDPEGHYRRVEFSTGVFSARDNRFNAYLRTRAEADILAIYQGQEPTVSLEGIADETSGHDATRRQYVGEKVVEVSYWSNGMQGSVLPNKRGYALTIRMQGSQAEVDALRPRVQAYLAQLQQAFGLESTNRVEAKREAA